MSEVMDCEEWLCILSAGSGSKSSRQARSRGRLCLRGRRSEFDEGNKANYPELNLVLNEQEYFDKKRLLRELRLEVVQ